MFGLNGQWFEITQIIKGFEFLNSYGKYVLMSVLEKKRKDRR